MTSLRVSPVRLVNVHGEHPDESRAESTFVAVCFLLFACVWEALSTFVCTVSFACDTPACTGVLLGVLCEGGGV